MKRSMKKRKGFTLVELAVVIAILAILALVAIPRYTGVVEEARSAQAKAQLGIVRSALSIYYAKHHGVFPTYDVFSAATNNELFANGQVPDVEITDTTGAVVRSHSVTDATGGTIDGVVEAGEVNPVGGGWVYDVSGDKTKADVRLNSTVVDPVSGQAWWTY